MSTNAPTPTDWAGLVPMFVEQMAERNQLEPFFREVYRSLVASLFAAAESRGLPVLYAMNIETAAYFYVLGKQKDAGFNGLALNWQDRERIEKMRVNAVNTILAELKLGDLEEVTKRQLGLPLIRATLAVVDRMEIPEDEKVKAKERIGAVAREHLL